MTFRDLEEKIDKLGDSVTPFLANKTAEQNIEFGIDPSKGLTKKRYGWYSNNNFYDNTLISDIPGGLELSTRANSNDTVRIRSSVPGQYKSQTLAVPGVGFNIEPESIVFDSNNLAQTDAGFVAIGAGWHDNSAGGWEVNGTSGTIRTFLGLTVDTEGASAVLVSQGEHKGNSPVPQENWNIDTLDGSADEDNPTGLQFRPDDGYIWNGPYTWYNQGALIIGFVDKERNKFIPVHSFEIDGVPSIDRPNMPTTVIIDNDGDAESVTVKVGGMQYSRYGTGTETETRLTPVSRITSNNYIDTQVVTNGSDSIDPRGEPGVPLISVRKQSHTEDTIAITNSISSDSDNDIYIFVWDEYNPETALTGQNFRQPTGVDTNETKMEADTEATDYTPSSDALLRGWKKLPGGKQDAPVATDRSSDSIPIGATRIYTAVHDGSTTDAKPFKIDIQETF